MTQRYKGTPVDSLDTACKNYKDCLECAKRTHGDMCIGEYVHYGLRGATCKDEPGSCGRALCECDAAFAKSHNEAKEVWDQDYHMFWSTSGWDFQMECVATGSGGSVESQCCETDTTAAILFNSHTKECCANGAVKPIGEC